MWRERHRYYAAAGGALGGTGRRQQRFVQRFVLLLLSSATLCPWLWLWGLVLVGLGSSSTWRLVPPQHSTAQHSALACLQGGLVALDDGRRLVQHIKQLHLQQGRTPQLSHPRGGAAHLLWGNSATARKHR